MSNSKSQPRLPAKNSKRPLPAKNPLALERVLRGKRLLLTGATGFLGKTLLELLLRLHPEIGQIYLLIRGDRRSSLGRYQREIVDSPVMAGLKTLHGEQFQAFLDQRLTVVPGDIAEEGLLTGGEPAMARGALDAVLHCAGLVNFEASLEKALVANTLGVANVIEFCRKHGAALMHVSTCYVAGEADGHRYEDDIPLDWCPKPDNAFNVRREIRDARAVIERIEASSHEQARAAEFHGAEEGVGTGSEGQAESRRKRWVEAQLVAEGLERALKWGWPNTYSYTKSMGEQLVFATREELAVTVVRPAVIESSLADPFPGWNQGANTSAPLTYLAGEGFRFYPARADLVLDVIPVDLVAHAMVPILGALLAGEHEPIYQLGTSDNNPFSMRHLLELVGLGNRVYQRDGRGTMGKLSRHLEATVTSSRTYELVSDTLPRVVKRAMRVAQSAGPGKSRRGHQFEQRINRILDQLTIARHLVKVYRPYIQELNYTFHSRNIRALYARLSPADAGHHPYAPDQLDWRHYWIDIHMPGLRRHIFPQLELHTRGRTRAPRRHRHLLELLDAAALRFGGHPALVTHQPSGQETALSYRELRERASRAGLMLSGRAIEPQARVLLIGENSPEWVLGFFSILYAGAVAVPLDQAISGDELGAICRIAEPSAVLISSTARARLGDALAQHAGTATVIEFEELARPFLLRANPPPRPELERKSVAAIFFTSGSTGTPKGVMLTHGNLTAEVSMLGRVFTLDENEVLLSLLPLHHTFEFTCGMLLPLASGARVVYPRGVDAANLSATLARVRPTALIGVPALWQAIHRRIIDQVEARGVFFHAAFDQLRELNRRLGRDVGLNLGGVMFRAAHQALGGRLKLAISGGAALPNRVAEFFRDLGLNLLEGYGLTESAPVLSVANPDEPLVPGSVGKPLVGVELKLDCAPGEEVGEIIARGPNVMAGYFRDQAATDAAIQDGFLHTGDLGRFDSEGRLYIVGRAKDVIVDAGGNNVYIDEIEETYGHSPYIKELAVVGLSTPGGEQVAALVVPAYARGQSRRAVHDQLQAHFAKVGAGLSPYKRIRIVRFTDGELPRTRTRKIRRAEVLALLAHMIQQPDAQPGAGADAIDVEPWLLEALAQVSTGQVRISSATRLIEDLGLDSLALAELGEHVAEHAGRVLRPEELGDLRTVADLQRAIAQGTNRPKLPSYSAFAEPFTPMLPAPMRRAGESLARAAQDAMLSRWLKPRLLGRGNVPANRNILVIANHCSHVDFALLRYALGAAGDQLVVLAARDYFFNTPLRRFVARNFTPLIPFDRERAQLDSLEQALGELAAGRSVLMFPEGTRSPDGILQEFKSGAGYLALRSGCDVLPIHIAGTYQVLGKGSLMPHYHPVEVRIGALLPAEQLREIADHAEGAGAYRSVANFMREAIVNLAQNRTRPRLLKALPLPLPSLGHGERPRRRQPHAT